MGGLMSTVKCNDLTNTTGGIPTVKSQQLIPTAWVNFNGTGTVAIRDSENVSSITDSAVTIYIVNFITTMANTNYSAVCSSGYAASGTSNWYTDITVNNFTTSGFNLIARHGEDTTSEGVYNTAIVMGGQA